MPTTDPSHPSVEKLINDWSRRTNRAVIFDFTGTPSDDASILLNSLTALFHKYLGWQMTPEEYTERLLGHSDREIVEIAVRTHGGGDSVLVDELLARHGDRYKQLVAERSPITDSAAELVAHLARLEVPMAIVTGAQRDDVLAVLNNCSTGEHIDLFVTVEDVEHGKPDPEGFLKGAALLGVEPQDVLVFEDSVPGIQGALAAGMRCVAVTGDNPRPHVLAQGVATTHRLSADLLDV